MRDDVLVVSSHLVGENSLRSSSFPVHGVECRSEFSYCQGLQEAWLTDRVIVNVEHDMEFRDELVAGLVDCPHPACAYPYLVYPTALQRFIYCATTTAVSESEYEEYRQHRLRVAAEYRAGLDEDELLIESPLPPGQRKRGTVGGITPDWIKPGDEWAEWSSIGFCKIAPQARSLPLDRMFWQWLEHAVNRVVSADGTRWHIHWPEVKHLHDYKRVPDHLW